jgi:hypothetical protein
MGSVNSMGGPVLSAAGEPLACDCLQLADANQVAAVTAVDTEAAAAEGGEQLVVTAVGGVLGCFILTARGLGCWEVSGSKRGIGCGSS